MNRNVLNLAVPNIISNLSVPLLGAVDTALVGHLEEVYYLGAIAVGGMIFNFIFWGFGFLRMGTTGLTARAFGEEDKTESVMTLTRALGWPLFSACSSFCFSHSRHKLLVCGCLTRGGALYPYLF